MRRRSTVVAAVAATLLATGMASGTAQATPNNPPATWCSTGWTLSTTWGASTGHPCWNPAHVKGWVDDRRMDRRCVFMRFDWYRNGYLVDSKDSPLVCDRDSSKEFTLRSADPYANWVNWQLMYV
jgi:hypothetical protein